MMIEEKKDSKKILLSVLGVAILIVAVVGISFAAVSLSATSGENTIRTGTITVSYSESENGILLTNALPTDDETGITLAGDREYFDFTVSTGASGKVTVPYELNVTEVGVTEGKNKLSNDLVKVYLTKVNQDAEEAVLQPTLVKDLTDSTLRLGSKKLLAISDEYTAQGTTTVKYRLRMWISTDATTDDIQNAEYKLLVNVDSNVNAINQ